MSAPLVECIPNFSEARRPEVIESILSAISVVPGVKVLDRHSDVDHNRTVITFAGEPAAVEEAAYLAIQAAAQLIDLNQHTGEHPRLGATDVVPFVPIRGISMQECIEMAQRLGKRVGETLEIPVYLYEEAASCAERKNLENIRRGEYELLKNEIGVRPERDPDYGPVLVGSAGATIIGARHPLVAFNVFLTTGDLTIAKKIAQAVRNSSGGLRYVKALGLLVEGKAQVSMNLTNFRQTPIARVVEFVRREAARYGVGILNTELVGLIPEEALIDAAIWHLQLDLFKPEQILEQRLNQALAEEPQDDTSLVNQEASFIDALAKGTPTPGGGSAAAHVGETAAALISMVAGVTTGKKKYAHLEPRMVEIIEEGINLRRKLHYAVEADAHVFGRFLESMRLPKDTPEQQAARGRALQQANKMIIQAPLKVAYLAVEVQQLAVELARTGNLNAISDAASAATLAVACLGGSALNVRVNCPYNPDSDFVSAIIKELSTLEETSQKLEQELICILKERGNLAW